MNESMTVTITIDEYRDLLKKVARFELLEEQKKAEEERYQKLISAANERGKENA